MADQYIRITWEQFHNDAQKLAQELRDTGWFSEINGIIAVARGGMIPAAILAYSLNCRLLHTVSISTYQDEERGKPEVLCYPELAQDGAGYLLVDDLVDEGVTAGALREVFPAARLCCLYAKPKGAPRADLYVREVPQTSWVVFPWESSDSILSKI